MFALRAPLSTLGGALISATFFLVLWQLVSVPMIATERATVVVPEFKRVRPDTPVEAPPRTKPTQPPPIDVIRPTGPGTDGEPITPVRPEPTPVDPPPRPRPELGTDRDSTPLVRINPDYPPRAEQGGIEGWVQVRFTVTAAGTVRDAIVVASEPGETFDRAALDAIARWRYNPRVENGEPVERPGLQTLFKFEVPK